jgi:DNA polymerase III subunit delta'
MARAPRNLDIEIAPEADRLEGFPHPRAAAKVFGHEDAEDVLDGAALSGRLHHAWLMTGPAGIGKATLAYRFARYLLASSAERSGGAADTFAVDPASRTARQVLSLSHPGLLVIRRPYEFKDKRFKASITIDEVRRLRDFLGHTSGAQAWRAVIVDAVDELNPNAANALLKSLEEPPERCVFLLISSEPGRLLATIRSRCRQLPLSPLGDDDLIAAARQAVAGSDGHALPTDDELNRLAALAGGSVRRLLTLATSDGGALSARLDRLLAGLGGQLNWAEAHGLADELAPAAAMQKFEAFYELLCGRLATAIRESAVAAPGAAAAAGGVAWLDRSQVAAWAELWETIVREKRDVLTLNLDRRAFVLETIARLQAAAGR